MRSPFLVAVHLFFLDEGKILLLQRFNTGYEDGNYSVVAGHVDAGETVTQAAIREALEEAGIVLQPEDLQVVHVMNRKSNDERVDFFIAVKSWSGEIRNTEPDKCDDLAWFSLEALPVNLIPYVRYAIENYQKGILYSEFGWPGVSRIANPTNI
jgi:8-oxo-dGTP diphosphatase